MKRLAGVPYARRYLVGQSLSILGDAALWLALAIWVRELTGSNAEAGLTFFFLVVPSLGGPLWGAIVDRLRRRPVLVAVNLLSGLVTSALLFVHGREQVWVIWAVMVGYGVSNSVLGAAQSGFLHTLLPDEVIGDAQGMLSTVREGIRLISPLLGAGLFTLVGGHVIALVDAGTFAVAAASAASIRVAEPEPVRENVRLRAEVAAGLGHIRRTVQLRQVITALVVTCSVVGFIETAGIAVVTSGLHRSPSWLGPFDAIIGVGALCGGPTVAAAMRRFGAGRVCAIGMIAFAAGCAVLIAPFVATAIVGALMIGFGLPWLIAAANTVAQRLTPSSLQGRVSSTVDVLTGVPHALSIALGAGLIAIVGYQLLLGVVGGVAVTAGCWLLTRPEQRPSFVPMPGNGPGAEPVADPVADTMVALPYDPATELVQR
jgi:MFS family permease